MSTDDASPADLPVACSIATSDSGCGAGIQADLLTFAARGVFGTNVFVALTSQNPDGVAAIETLPAAFIESQWRQVSGFFKLGAVKTGMLFSDDIIEGVARLLDEVDCPIVVDPVMVASSGAVLLQREAINVLKSTLLPRATLITPNLDEAAVLAGNRARDLDAMRGTAQALRQDFGTAVLLKGGHLEGDTIYDVLVDRDGEEWVLETEHLGQVDTHGSGCTLASAIAAELAKGHSLEEAVRDGHRYVKAAMASPLQVGGRRFISHGVDFPEA